MQNLKESDFGTGTDQIFGNRRSSCLINAIRSDMQAQHLHVLGHMNDSLHIFGVLDISCVRASTTLGKRIIIARSFLLLG